jgi:putative thioredoxin
MTQQGLAQCELMIRTQGVDPRDAIAKADALPNDLAANRLAADVEVGSGMFEAGFNRLISFIKANPGDQRKEAKEHLLLLFSVVPPEEPTLIKARRDLASALF